MRAYQKFPAKKATTGVLFAFNGNDCLHLIAKEFLRECAYFEILYKHQLDLKTTKYCKDSLQTVVELFFIRF